MAWSSRFRGVSRSPRSSQLYRLISRRQSRQPRQMTSRRRLRRSAVTRMPSATSLLARTTVKPRRRSVSMKLAAEGSAMTRRMLRPAASFWSSSAYSSSVFCCPALRES